MPAPLRLRPVLVALLVLLPLAALIYHYSIQHGHAQQSREDAPAAAASSALPATQMISGNWGTLLVSRIVIEPPESLVGIPTAVRVPVRWNFIGSSRAEVEALWESARLTPAQLNELRTQTRIEERTNRIVVHPSDKLVLGLSAESRGIIYLALAQHPDNPDQHEPYRFRAEVAEEWFERSEISPATIALVKSLLYRRGNTLLFSDLGLVLPTVPTLAERVQLVKTLARKSSLIVRLQINPGEDLDRLEFYWGRGQRSRDIRPLLESVVRQGPGANIDIIHLLPRIPRALLYTYPLPSDLAGDGMLDCHWTSFNFFRITPEVRFRDIDFVRETFHRDYHPLRGKPTFGDLVVLGRGEDQVIHTCVVIAGDIVFTKNGSHASAPWIFMSLSDMIAAYPTTEPLDVQYYRSRQFKAED